MDSSPGTRRLPWGFWIACALAVAGGVTPLLLAGSGGRVNGVIFIFWFGAACMAGCALLEHRGRLIATVLYLVGALAIVYGILGMVAVMLQLTVMTVCPPAPAPCEVGYARALTAGENSGIDYALVLGMLAVGFGFVGMLSNYRQHRPRPLQAAPPVRRLPPEAAHRSGDAAPDAESAAPTGGASE